MTLADLKSVQAYAREVNDKMKSLAMSAHSGEVDVTRLLAELIGEVAVLSGALEKLANHLMAGSGGST
jgi:hypothetical protein